MITRHHLALTILCSLILCSAVVPGSLLFTLVICLGAGIGTILPDIQMKKPHHIKARTVAWTMTRFSSIVCTPLMCRGYRHLAGLTIDPNDKRLTHSIFGIISLFLVPSAMILIPVSVLMDRAAIVISAAFLGGLLLGLILHLAEDLCTRKGISPFFPFSTLRISGSIRPCDGTDRRIAQFHYFDCSITGVICCFLYSGSSPGAFIMPASIAGLCACLGMMIGSSDVEIRSENERDGAPAIVHQAVMLDPISFLGTPRYSTQGLMMGVYYYHAHNTSNG